jgi:hypothetical protein
MSKIKDRKKERKLRQEIEILKAQLGSNSYVVAAPAASESTSTSATKPIKVSNSQPSFQKMEMIDDKYIKQDLMKTVILSAGAFSIIILLWIFNITTFNF